MSCPRNSLTKALDRGEDLVGGLGPDEGLGGAVLDVDVVGEGALEFKRAAMRTATKLAVCGLRSSSMQAPGDDAHGRTSRAELVGRNHQIHDWVLTLA
jgi:hypothetical protein